MYQKEEVERLAEKYVETGNEQVFEALIKALRPLINVQLGKNYSSLKEFWDDLRKEVLLRISKNRGGLSTTKSKSLYQFLYQRIRRDLFRAAKKMNKAVYSRSKEEEEEEVTIQHGNVTVMEFNENGSRKSTKIIKPKPVKIKKGDIDHLPESLELIERQRRANFERQMVGNE